MAKMDVVLPDDVMQQFKDVYDNTDHIFGEMTKAGAQAVLQNVKMHAPTKQIADKFKLSKVYHTPSDGGINTKIYASGYIPFSETKQPWRKYFSRSAKGTMYTTTLGLPVDFLCKVFEYGRKGAPFPKKPFFRNSFKSMDIETAMYKAQKLASNGMLTDEDFHSVDDLGYNPFD